MITHLALNSHPNPQRVLVIGGGDGGVLREIVKHESVKEAVLVEIDECVIRVAKQYLPDMSRGFDHPKVTLCVEDGFKYLSELTTKFDVIITDSSDPEGPAAALFGVPFYNLLSRSLADDNGIVVTQCSENIWLNLSLLKEFRDICRKVFPVVEYAYTTVPTYTSGQLGLFVCCKNPTANVKIPLRKWDEETETIINRYYNSALHTASFVLPTWAKLILNKK
jgi:spermidine synthase